MTTYARITAGGGFDRLVELTQEQYEALQANGKATYLRLWVIDAKPVPSSNEVVIDAGIVIGPVDAHQTWGLRAKTQAELDAESNAAERPTVAAFIAALTTDIAAYNPNPDVSGTAVERIAKLEARVKELERQTRRGNVIDRFTLRDIL